MPSPGPWLLSTQISAAGRSAGTRAVVAWARESQADVAKLYASLWSEKAHVTAGQAPSPLGDCPLPGLQHRHAHCLGASAPLGCFLAIAHGGTSAVSLRGARRSSGEGPGSGPEGSLRAVR